MFSIGLHEFSQVLWLPVQRYADVWMTADSKLAIGADVSVIDCLSLCVRTPGDLSVVYPLPCKPELDGLTYF